MSESQGNGAQPQAVVAQGLRKRYRLGELRSLQQTVNHLLLRRGSTQTGGLEALAGVDFEVPQGQSFGIVGTNGSGKSTLLQILAGTTLPSGGAMRVRGRVIPLLAVGMNFHPELTGHENVTLFAASLGVPRRAIASRMDAVTAFAELERHMDTPMKRFSSGMVSRLSFSIAMQFPADIYVFDEVLAVVDGEFQSRCIEAIKRLHQEGRTIFFVSHSLDQVAEVCERTMWLERGVVRDLGPTEEVLAAYTSMH
jgi:ABC-type polysaccharide/polyol phosphate transport system ATPase subunit